MIFNSFIILFLIAIAFNGILTGASLDQSIKQLPARHKIGLITYTKYSQAADLGKGIWFYAILGIGFALVTIASAVSAYIYGLNMNISMPLYVAAALAILHSLVTTQAAPINFSQRKVDHDEEALKNVFNRFERWQTVRAILNVLIFSFMLWALYELIVIL
jgi:hypothetical protein